MADNINKVLYLGFGVILLVVALTTFYNSHQSLMKVNQVYHNRNNDQETWVKDLGEDNENPLNIVTTNTSLTKKGLIYSGSDVKAQLIVILKEYSGYTIYKDGIEVLESDYASMINNILNEEVLITFDKNLNSVYIVTL